MVYAILVNIINNTPKEGDISSIISASRVQVDGNSSVSRFHEKKHENGEKME
jgi:hypothetical protein